MRRRWLPTLEIRHDTVLRGIKKPRKQSTLQHQHNHLKNMALEYNSRQLYGGAITVDFPTDAIDSSDLRQIPDHQEVFIRPKTLTSVIFEINEYQTQATVSDLVEVPAGSEANSSIPVQDAAAATYHLHDIIQAPDHLSEAGIDTQAIHLTQSSVSKFPAYLSTATIITPEIDRSAAATSTLPVSWQSNPVQTLQETKAQQLLVRLEQYGVDFCVRIDVPLKEFTSVQSEAALTEMAIADQIMKRIIDSLDVKDFGLFGGE